MATDFKQYDSRWGSKSYSGGTMSGCGCGPTSVADIANEIDSKVLPPQVADWMTSHGFAGTNGGGTIRYGITHALEAYGLTEVEGCRTYAEDQKGTNDPSMKHFCELMCDGNHRGVILFSGGTKGGITWTLGGHFICVDGGKKNGNDYLLHMCDSGQREHDGWYSYNNTMAGLCFRAYIGKMPNAKEKKSYEGNYPSVNVKIEKDRMVMAQEYGEKVISAGKVKYKRPATNKQLTACFDCNPTMGAYTQCIGFVGAMLRHGGGITNKCGCNGVHNGSSNYSTCTLSWVRNRLGSNDWQECSINDNCRKLIYCFDKKSGKYVHTAFGCKDGYVLDATSSSGLKKRKTNFSTYKLRVYKYTGAKAVTTRNYIMMGSAGTVTNVKRLQKYLNWYGNYGLVVDGEWGNATNKAVIQMQTDFFGSGQADGKIGAKTLKKMKAVKK